MLGKQDFPRLFFALCIAIICFWVVPRASGALPFGRIIYVRTLTPRVPYQTLRNDLPAFQAALAAYEPVWHFRKPTLLIPISSLDTIPDGAWLITVKNPNDVNCWFCYGFHSFTPGNRKNDILPSPYAEVGADKGWTVTFTHELFEMLSDPLIRRLHAVGNRHYLVEPADPVEDNSFAWPAKTLDDKTIMISDFPTPNWYRPGSSPPYDSQGFVQKPLQVLCGGYVSWKTDNQWFQEIGPDCNP